MADDALFTFEARRDGRPVAIFHGRPGEGAAIVVEAQVRASLDEELTTRPFTFDSRDHALRFVDEALVALEYLGCDVGE